MRARRRAVRGLSSEGDPSPSGAKAWVITRVGDRSLLAAYCARAGGAGFPSLGYGQPCWDKALTKSQAIATATLIPTPTASGASLRRTSAIVTAAQAISRGENVAA